MTLSHCWGFVKPLRHTAQTKSRLQSGIALEELSKTFRDATTVAQTLHCRYFWIDSLYIVQDDWKDGDVEASQMNKVYDIEYCSNCSINSFGGLFSPRDPSAIMPCKFNLKGAKGPEHALLVTPPQFGS